MQGRAVEDFVPADLFHTPTLGEVTHVRPDGTLLQLRFACAAFRVRGRELQVVSALDAGPQPGAARNLLETQKLEAIGRLAGGVAHDFNNLLTGIMLYCDLLIAESEQDSRVYRRAREMRMAGEQGAKLVQQLLAVARPQALESRVFALNTVVIGIQDLLSRLIGENILLTTLLADDLGAVRMDPAHVQQILLNLVLNARDAMPEGGHILLTTRNCTGSLHEGRRRGKNESEIRQPQLAPCVELTVSDTGGGMDSETLGRAFEPFFTTKMAGRGSGLGLATAYQLAKLEGGTIVAESHLGRGTRVSLLLPRVDLDNVSQAGADQMTTDQGGADQPNVSNSVDPNTTSPNPNNSVPNVSIKKLRGDSL